MAPTKLTLMGAIWLSIQKGAMEWIEVPGNYERLTPFWRNLIEQGMTSYEAAVAAAAEAGEEPPAG